MTNSEFNAFSGAAPSLSGGECGDWDGGTTTTSSTLERIFQEGYSNPYPFLPPAAYTAFPPTENGLANAAAGRGFETHPQQFGAQMNPYTSATTTAGKFVQRPPPPPLSSSLLGFQVSQQTQVNEYWASLAMSMNNNTNTTNWKMEYNPATAMLSDFGQQCMYDEFNTMPLHGEKLGSSFALCADTQNQTPDEIIHFSPNQDGGVDYTDKRWNEALGFREQGIASHHGLPYTFFDDSNVTTGGSVGTTFPSWTNGGDTVSPKALTLSSSSVSFEGSESSECGSLDSVSTSDGLFGSAGEIQGAQEGMKQEMGQEARGRRKLPERPARQYVAIAPSGGRNSQVVDRACEREIKTCTSPATAKEAPRNTPASTPRSPHPQSPTTRSTKDAFLIASKQAGMSYRAIRIAGNFSEAESTLRGRYRTLTKVKEERVRKPEWTEGDVRLLREGVERYRCAGRGRGRSGKTPWKRVAEYIEGNGGSYRFGNATCRKMWDRLREEGEDEG
ncbi:hypothetical protein V492_01130 [Pseudogymnoascus sp. VKM F-4246]|nr:hypothetical protein V492_01130 [Pseudogymnoascus sp. VKM F-4246]